MFSIPPFCHGSRHDGGHGADESHLQEEPQVEFPRPLEVDVGGEEEVSDAVERGGARPVAHHQAEAEGPEAEAGQRHVHDVLHQDVHLVLHRAHAGLEVAVT